MNAKENAESARVVDADTGRVPWRRWGPYLSERQWGTVREDYSEGGDAWSYFTHDAALYRAYRWGEDGIAGMSDDKQIACISLALWNGRDPMLKERLFGLSNSQGNHGEDVKEYYFYLDATPTSSYLKMLYKYPQGRFPYEDLLETNARRGKLDPEYELIDTGVFDEDRYFDVFVEYAKASAQDILMQVTVHNRGPDEASLHLLPTILFRHTWSWAGGGEVPSLVVDPDPVQATIAADHPALGRMWFCAESATGVLVTGNETNNERTFGSPNQMPYLKDGIDRAVVHGQADAVDPSRSGTKASFHHELTVAPGGSATIRLRISDSRPAGPFGDFDEIMTSRRSEADVFWLDVLPESLSSEERMVCRQALSGMLWSKQYYELDVERWLVEHGADPLDADPSLRNHEWRHMVAGDLISMPDKWEYPWFAAWDLAFHTVALAVVDVGFAKEQLQLLLSRRYLHPNGQLPAYEWNFSDVNPPVHAWATLLVYQMEKARVGKGDLEFLESSFQKLMRNFTWWLNRKDADDRNIFQGGFLGLDNIGVFDRSAPLPTGGRIDQADGTAWMALYAQNMLQIALELARTNRLYLQHAQSLLENLAWIAAATNHVGPDGGSLWDEEDGFFYDLLRRPDGTSVPLKVRSVVGLMPLAAATVLPASVRSEFPELLDGAVEFLHHHPAVTAALWGHGTQAQGNSPLLLSLFDEQRLRRILSVMLDEEEFLGAHGIRAVSRFHLDHPYVFTVDGAEYRVNYLPAESDTGMFGGNSNWRGPMWMPINVILLRSLLNLHVYYGEDFKVECPTGSGRLLNLLEVARDLADRIMGIFMRGPDGRRPVHGGQPIMQTDPHWRDLLLFYEYFHGDNGAGIGASHQTGWSGCVGALPLVFNSAVAASWLAGGQTEAQSGGVGAGAS